MNMKKLLALMLALALFLPCLGAAADGGENPVLATAYDGAVSVSLSEVKEEFDQMVDTYVQYYAQYGYNVDKYDTELQSTVAQEVVQMELSQRVAEYHAAQTGYEVTPETDERYKAEALAALAEMLEYYKQVLLSYGIAEEETEAVAKEEMEASGYTYDTLYESAKLKGVLDHLYVLATEGVEVTPEEVEMAFNAKVEEQKTTYDANVDEFINAYINREDVLYTPENVRVMQCIYTALEDQSGEEAAEGEQAAAETAAQDETDPLALKGLARANAVLAKLQAGEDFEALMKAYNEDSSTEEEMTLGYPIAEGSTMYGDEFKNAAMALEKIGDVSDVVATDYGYFILRYAADIEPSRAGLDERREAETEEALANKKNEAYSAYVNTMLDEANLELGDLSPMYNVFVGEACEATVAYASVTQDTELTDMPSGAAVAKLAAGATLDVLGRIDVEGESYAFVAVPGTGIKGYVKDGLMTDMDEADALAVDNAALATRCDVESDKPIFTIVMNDGSVIYGELYPQTAPESVGNFAALANASFYDGLIFHRVIPGFMIQGGDPEGNGTGGPGYAIKGEFSENGVDNGLSHVRGVLSMARSSEMDSAGSQFFIMHADGDFLDGQYAAFGLVLGGMETVDLIASEPTNSSDKPMSDQTMRTVYVETYGRTYEFTKLGD